MIKKTIPYLLFVSDCLFGIVAFLIAMRILSGAPGADVGALEVALSGLVINAGFFSFRLYNAPVLYNATQQIIKILGGVVLSVLILIAVSYFLGFRIIMDNPFLIVNYAFIGFIFTAVFRTAVAHPLYMYYVRRNIIPKNILIIGADYVGQLMAAKINLNRTNEMNVVGFLDDNLAVGLNIFKNKKVIGRLKEISKVIPEYDIDEVLYCFSNGNYVTFQEILDICNKTNTQMRIASPFFDVVSPRIQDEKVGISVTYDFYPNHSKVFNVAKRGFDIICSVAGGILLMPVFLLIAMAIKIDSRGPVLYVHTRLGKDGKPFRFYKFRSMIVDSDKDDLRKETMGKFINGHYVNDNGSTKIVDEAKVTRVGKLLRRFSIDEFPQLYNVVKGDMSLVGPRPCLPYEWNEYDEWHKKRLSVIPGCTGLWQVTGRSKVGFNDMVILDLYYIQNSSFQFDIKLIFQTLPVMMFGKGGE